MARGQVEHGRWSGQSSNGDDGFGFHRMVGKEGRKGAVIAAFGGFGCWFRTVISQRAHFDELDVSTVEYVTNRTVHSNFFLSNANAYVARKVRTGLAECNIYSLT